MILTSDERGRQLGSGVLLRKRHYLAFKGVNLGKEVIKMPSTEEIERALRKCELPKLVWGTKHDDPGLRLRTAEVLGGRFYDEPEAVAALRSLAVLGPESLFRGLAKLMGSELEAWAVSKMKEIVEEPEVRFEPEVEDALTGNISRR